MAISADRFDWNDIPILVALAHSGSMRTAARHLGVTTSTVSRRLAAAERAIQTRLFVRGPDGYKPTDTGRMFLAEAEQIEGSVHALLSDTNRDSEAIKGPVRITSVDVMLNDWLIPRLPDLRSIYPEIEIQVIADNQVLSFNRGECDLALRAARPREDASILMRKIGTGQAICSEVVAAFYHGYGLFPSWRGWTPADLEREILRGDWFEVEFTGLLTAEIMKESGLPLYAEEAVQIGE